MPTSKRSIPAIGSGVLFLFLLSLKCPFQRSNQDLNVASISDPFSGPKIQFLNYPTSPASGFP